MTEAPVVKVVTEEAGTTVVASGLLDLTNSAEFARELKQASTTAERLVVDFQEAVFIDTAIVQYVASAAIAVGKRGGRLAVRVKRGSHPEHVVDVLGFKQLMDIEVAAAQST